MDLKAETFKYEDLNFANKSVMDRSDYRRRRCSLMVEIINNQISPVDIQKMMEAGMNVAKFSTSYSTTGDRIRLLGVMDRAANVCSTKYSMFDWPVATSGMLKTCVVKTGILEKDVAFVKLTKGSQVVLTSDLSDFDKCSESLIFVDNSHMAADMKVGLEVSLNEADVVMVCTEIIDDKKILCEITKSGPLANMSTLCVRGMKRSRPYMTNKDLQIITFCLQYQMDMIIIYYVRHVMTIIKTKEFIGKKRRPLIFGALCTQEGLENIDDVLKECDGIVLPREIITYELPKEKANRVPFIQKYIAGKCQQAGKPFFISGGVLEELVVNGEHRSCDVSDVTNALLDGVTGFILTKCFNAENTIEAIYTLNEICCSVEPILYHRNFSRRIFDAISVPCNAAEAAVMACALTAVQTNAKLIILPTVTGRTAKALVHLNPCCLVIAVSTDIRVSRLLSVYRATVPLVYKDKFEQISLQRIIQKRVDFAIEYALFMRWVDAGDTYVTLSRSKDSSAYCDSVRIWTVQTQRKALVECDDDET